MIPQPDVSVIICTHNPRLAQFRWMLASLESQTMSRSRFEVIVVDNHSSTPLRESELRDMCDVDLQVLREPRIGLTYARCTGIQRSRADILVFVDDDNHLFPDYLDQAAAIAAREPRIGHFGGISLPLHEEPIREWQKKFLPSLGVRDHGPAPITSAKNSWGEWEPIGAGMVCRRAIAEYFTKVVEGNGLAQLLGRKGSALMSGEDTLLARVAVEMGYACSYQPALRLFHFIRAARLRPRTLARTMLGHGRSYVILEELSRRPVPAESYWKMVMQLAQSASYRVVKEGLRAGSIQWCWDLGRFLQIRSGATQADTTPLSPPLTAQPSEPRQHSAR